MNFRGRDGRRLMLVVVLASCAGMVGSGALAQIVDGALTIPAEIEVRGRGWTQVSNLDEMLDFALTLVETTLLTAFLAFHPANFGQNRASASHDLRKGMFLFAFIGMLTGFLVLHHGYLIGFVIFGIGGLFRFRMESSSISDTAKLVIVSLIGLAAGLDLPVMALIATVASWTVIWCFGRTQSIALEVKFDPNSEPQSAMLKLKDHFSQTGFSVTSMSKPKFKPIGQYVLSSSKADARALLVHQMSEFQKLDGNAVEDWHID